MSSTGLKIHMAHQYDFSYYSHNKYWIVDKQRVGVSTGNSVPTRAQVLGTAWCASRRVECGCLRRCSHAILSAPCAGNWAPTDFPGPPNRCPSSALAIRQPPSTRSKTCEQPCPPLMCSYPPYGDPAWRKTNRDFTLRVTDPQVVELFRQVHTRAWHVLSTFSSIIGWRMVDG